MKHTTITETINPEQTQIVNLFDTLEGEWGDVSKSFDPNIESILHSNVLFINGIVDAGTNEIKINKNFNFSAKKSILDIYEIVGGEFVQSSFIASVENKTITIPSISNDFLLKGFLISEQE